MNRNIRKAGFDATLLAASLLGSSCLLARPISADVPRFLDPAFFPTGVYSPHVMVTADFNGDGISDAASINDSETATVIGLSLSNGDGSFQPTQIYNVGGLGPSDLATADLNGDGITDLAVSLLGGHRVAVLLGNGDGTFGNATTFEAGKAPSSVALGDLNEDGKIDAVVSNASGPVRGISVLLGNGDGTLQPPVASGTGVSPHSVVLSDFNGDGHLDVAVVNTGSDTFSILLGNGNGTFGTATSYPTLGSPFHVVIGDFDHDSHPDLAVSYLLNLTVSVFLGNSDGTFQPAQDTPAPFYYLANIAAADLNDDGNSDLVLANVALTVLLGQGDGTFQAPASYYRSAGVVTLGQYDGTGGVDALIYRQRDEYGFSLIPGNPDGTFDAPRSFPAPINDLAAAASDLDQNGKPDLVVASTVSTTDNQGQVSVFLNNGNGIFAARVDAATGHNPTGIALGDLNSDASPDIVTANQADNSVTVLLGIGGGAFQAGTDYSSGTSPVSVATADFNSDGRADLATANNTVSGSVSILLGSGDGSFPSHVELAAAAYPGGIAAGDLNGDGKADLAVSYQNDADQEAHLVSVFIGNGDGTFEARTDYSLGSALNPGGLVGIADVNDDTMPDLVVAIDSFIKVLLNNGDGTFQAPVESPGASPVRSFELGDIDGDNFVDLVVGGVASETHKGLLLGNGDGTFSPPVHYFDFGLTTAVADFNSDGALDVADVPYGIVSVLLNTGGSQISLASSNNPSHAGEKVTFRARVNPTVGSAVPSGTVEFLDGEQTLGTAPLLGGTATFSTSDLSVGRHRIQASYSGDAVFVPIRSKPRKQIVDP